MRIFAVSDVHVDHQANAAWIGGLSADDYRDDVLILAGDVSDSLARLEWCLDTLVRRFRYVMFVPGNHDIWVIREDAAKTSIDKFYEVCAVARATGALMQTLDLPGLSIVPLLGWYDYSFGMPGEDLKAIWMDFRACRWAPGQQPRQVADFFAQLNRPSQIRRQHAVCTFSHFLPRIDLMPSYIPPAYRILYPVLGSLGIDRQLRDLGSSLHVYGHSHVNRDVRVDGVRYVNNALAYPHEQRIASRQLLCIHEL